MKRLIACIAATVLCAAAAAAELPATDAANAAKLEQAGAIAAERAAERSDAAKNGVPAGSGWGSREEVSVGGSAIKMVSALGLALGVLFIGLHIHRKVTGRAPTVRSRRMRIVERLPVSAKTALVLVEFDGRPMVLSVGADRVTAVEPQVAEFSDVERLCRDEAALAAVGS